VILTTAQELASTCFSIAEANEEELKTMTKKEITDYIETLEKFLLTAFNSKPEEKLTRPSKKLSDMTRV
jgi:hypothetical protein